MTGGPLLPKDISSAEGVERMMPVGSSDNPREAGAFQPLLQKQAEQTGKPGQFVSPFELARGTPQLATGPTLASIQTQALHAQTTLADINNMLQTQGLKVKPSSKYLLRNKLSDASQQFHTVNAKVGGQPQEEKETQELPAGHGPIQQLLAYVGGSQVALASTQKKIQELSEKQGELNPAEMLFVQIKLNKAQQLLDYSSVLLAKAIDAMKMLFSIQL